MEETKNSPPPDVRDYVEFLLKRFLFERIVYSTATIISVVGLFFCIYSLMTIDKEIPGPGGRWSYIIGLAGPSGVISYSCAKILEMWKDSVMLVSKFIDKAASHE